VVGVDYEYGSVAAARGGEGGGRGGENAMPLYVDPNPKPVAPTAANGMSNGPVYSIYVGSTPSEQATYAEANPDYAPAATNVVVVGNSHQQYRVPMEVEQAAVYAIPMETEEVGGDGARLAAGVTRNQEYHYHVDNARNGGSVGYGDPGNELQPTTDNTAVYAEYISSTAAEHDENAYEIPTAGSSTASHHESSTASHHESNL
jgi:hypothetical protein